MGKSKNSCFKIITCARGDSADADDLGASPESKVSSDKRWWSFRKRSPGHQVPSSTVLSEPVCVGSNKETPEVTANNFHSPKCSSVSEKAPAKDTPNDVSPVSTILLQSELIAPLIPDKNSTVSDHNIQESVVIIIQASIRGYLVRREAYKIKNVIKLQAAVRGHLVRRQAVGTLRCHQAIIKLQALIRARRAHMFSKKLDEQEDEKFQLDMQSPAILGKENSSMKADKKCTSAKNLLSNGFARQLLESTPKTKPIYINCDPSKSDSAWKWLERWMAVTLSAEQEEEKNIQDFQRQEENSKPLDYEAGNDEKFAQLSVITSDSKFTPCESTVPAENEMNLIAKNPSVFEVHDSTSNPGKSFDSVVKDDHAQSPLENEAADVKQEKGKEVKVHIEKYVSPFSQMPLQTDTSELLFNSISDNPGSDSNLEKLIMKASSEPLDTEGKEFIVGSKPCNTVFTPGQSKFGDMITTSTVGRTSHSAQDAPADLRLDGSCFYLDSSTNNKNLILAENSFSHDPMVQVPASECGTEISISSTLDSFARSEAEGGEIVLGLGSLEKQKYDANYGSNVSFNPGNAEVKSPSFHQEVQQPKRPEERDQNPARSIPSSDVVQAEQQLAELTASYMQSQAENSIDQQIDRSSLQGTPRSHTTATELHGTPSSQNSVYVKKKKKETRKSDGKIISQIGNRSPSKSTKDSGGSSAEQLQKDSKNAKRRNTLGIAKAEHVDQEPRLSASNPLPSYMQATESARAKAHASISPKSSPDLHNKDTYIKKRHSLPIANGKQGSSPRMQKSPSHAHQSPKGNGIHSPHDTAERRWQR